MTHSQHLSPHTLDLDLSGRVAIVTGASRSVGIGAATCRALAALGADIFFTHWHPYDQATLDWRETDGPDRLLADLRAMGVRAAAAEIDFSRPEAAEQVLDTCEREVGPPTILINNATHSVHIPWEQVDAAAMDDAYAVNLRTFSLLSLGFARRWPGGDRGRIISLTSGQDRGAMTNELPYVATKAAVVAFSRTLAVEVAPKGIRVNCVNPGPTDTGWMTPELHERLVAMTPLGAGRVGQPQDAARLIAFLASDAAMWITGQTLNSEGGFGV
jgi:3-oxoacyl-[acyl-carrier protein] reductase